MVRTDWVVRIFEQRDAQAVKGMWKEGFLEMAWDFTRTLGPLIPFVPATRPIRPVATGIALAGVTRAAVALVRREGRDKVAMGAAIAGAGLGALALFHLQARRMITKMCDQACNAPDGDMFDIEKTWVKAPGRTFFVAADPASGAVVGSTAVARGGVKDMGHSPTLQDSKELSEPDACSVWKVSTSRAARGKGVAAKLMEAAERWAADTAGAKRMVLVTASPGAKLFYRRIGYKLVGGSMRGTDISFWEKTLYPSDSHQPSTSKGGSGKKSGKS